MYKTSIIESHDHAWEWTPYNNLSLDVVCLNNNDDISETS